MKVAALNQLCQDLWDQYQADPYDLWLTTESRQELWTDVTGGDIAGVVTTFLNPVTGSVIDISTSENDFDSVIVELHIPAGA